MNRFVFRLEAVRSLREQRQQQAQQELASELQLRELRARELEDASLRVDRALSDAAPAAGMTTTAQQLAARQAWVGTYSQGPMQLALTLEKGDPRRERLREGLVVAIAGPPNVGKSSLLNRIARRDAAIVSSVPGTTRDVIEVHLDLAGFPVTLLDTAGIHDSADPVEQEGIRRAVGVQRVLVDNIGAAPGPKA